MLLFFSGCFSGSQWMTGSKFMNSSKTNLRLFSYSVKAFYCPTCHLSQKYKERCKEVMISFMNYQRILLSWLLCPLLDQFHAYVNLWLLWYFQSRVLALVFGHILWNIMVVQSIDWFMLSDSNTGSTIIWINF